MRVPVNNIILGNDEKILLLECLKENFISSQGKFIKKFEEDFASLVQRKYATSVVNGTAALQLAVESLNLKKGDEVILPSFTIISCILPVIRCGLKPVLIDSDPVTWNMDINLVKKNISKKTKLIIAPHIYGLPVDMTPLLKLAKDNNIKIIEDAAEALGMTYKGVPCGSFGDVSTFSFYANKHITTGEGGMVVTNSQKINYICSNLKNLSFSVKRRFVHHSLGWNYRFTNIQAALGLAQLKKIDTHIKKKRLIGKIYNEGLSNLSTIQLPLSFTNYSENIYWVYGIVLKKNAKITRKELIKKLSSSGIETRNFFWPMHKQPIFKKMNLFKKVKLPVAENLANNGFYLPSGLAITLKQQKYVISKLKKFLNE